METLVLFARSPRAHDAKTRLAPVLGREARLRLHRALVIDGLALMARVQRPALRRLLCLSDVAGVDALPALPPEVRVVAQGPGELGARLARCLAREASGDDDRVVFIGSDAPTLRAAQIEASFAALDASDAVTRPAEDGGYVLIGVRGPRVALFDGIAWGGADVHRQTVSRARALGLKLAVLPGTYDVDRPADLARLREELRAEPELHPRTRAVLDDELGPTQGR